MLLAAPPFASRPSRVPKVLAASLVAVALAAGVYLAAAVAASRVAATWNVQETLRHARAVELEAAATRALAQQQAQGERVDRAAMSPTARNFTPGLSSIPNTGR